MSFRNHQDGFGAQLAAAGHASSGAQPLPWWVGNQLLYGEAMGQGRPASPEDACRDGQFQVVPRAQALLDAAPVLPPQQQLMSERGIPEVMKFSMAHGEAPLLCPWCARA
jgi:nuclear transcription factor Y alpha